VSSVDDPLSSIREAAAHAGAAARILTFPPYEVTNMTDPIAGLTAAIESASALMAEMAAAETRAVPV
jgi:hypothetical protein